MTRKTKFEPVPNAFGLEINYKVEKVIIAADKKKYPKKDKKDKKDKKEYRKKQDEKQEEKQINKKESYPSLSNNHSTNGSNESTCDKKDEPNGKNNDNISNVWNSKRKIDINTIKTNPFRNSTGRRLAFCTDCNNTFRTKEGSYYTCEDKDCKLVVPLNKNSCPVCFDMVTKMYYYTEMRNMLSHEVMIKKIADKPSTLSICEVEARVLSISKLIKNHYTTYNEQFLAKFFLGGEDFYYPHEIIETFVNLFKEMLGKMYSLECTNGTSLPFFFRIEEYVKFIDEVFIPRLKSR